MATSGLAKTLLGGFPTTIKAQMERIMEYIFDRNLSFGPIDHQQATDNFRGVYLQSTTAATTGVEFSVAHGLTRVPNVFWQVGDPLTVNSQTGVQLTVTRAADANRIYLTSDSTSVPFTLYVE